MFFMSKASKPKNKFFNNLFVVVSIAALLVVMATFSFLLRQLRYPVAKELISESYYSPSVPVRTETDDPFITKGEAAKELLLSPVVDGRDPQIGPDDAKITIVEFSDFSCDVCAQQEEVIKEVMEKYKDQIKLVWKDLPDVDTLSYEAAVAARCAGEQGKFWQVHDFLFSDPGAFSASLSDVSDKTGLNSSDFSSCFSSGRHDSDIKRNMEEASALRIPGVPFFFVGDQEYLGSIDKEDLERIIEKGL